MKYKLENGTITITGCDSSPVGALIIPDMIDGCPVTSIGEWAFSGCTGLTSVTIPCGTPCIGDYAFSGCTELLKLSLDPLMFKCGTHNVLNNHGVKSALDLASKTELQLMRFRGVGKKRLNEIKEKLNSFGLKLAAEPPV